EYQKDIPNMKENICAEKLGLDDTVFKIAIDKLQNEGLIKGAMIANFDASPTPYAVVTDYIKMTREGIDYVENKIGIDKTLTGAEKVKKVLYKMGELGFEQLKDIAAKVLSE